MKASNSLWREQPLDSVFPDLLREIEIYETEIELRKQNKLDEKLFAETRLRRGAYGQRYDNGQRWDGRETQALQFPSGESRPTKGANTLWDAPGMQRIKIPFGGMDPRQLEVMAELAEEYSDGIGHVTTRQDFQLHFVHIEDTPALMRRLAAVGITTREACGNSVRNVTACPFAGVCSTEAFDVTPYARGLAYFLLGHPDVQDFGRKFKVAFSGCKAEACGLVNMHDMGVIAVKRVDAQGLERRGFELYVGGGLGTVPHQAKLFDAFLPEEELLPTAQAISRVFARLGEKKNRNRARIKFLVAQLGIEEFRRIVLEERATLPPDPRWTAYLSELHALEEKPLRPAQSLNGAARPAGFEAWYKTNLWRQKQPGYVTAIITLPLGDITSDQMRAVADVTRRFTNGTIRTTVDQNLVLRWISEADLPEVYAELNAIGLGQAGAGTIVDITSCPGTDTCKLGIASSRGLAGELRQRLAEKSHTLDEAVQNLHIKVSGCFNSCGQHHIADLGFYGVSRHSGNYTVPHFQVVLGGQWKQNGGSYGLAMGAVPAKRIPEVVERLTGRYVAERQKGENFQTFIQRVGKVEIKKMLDDLTRIPTHDEEPTLYTDWGDNREFTIGDMGVGECAGEIVSHAEFGLAAAERQVFEAQVFLDQNAYQQAGETAYASMLQAAKTLVQEQFYDVPNDPDRIVEEFRTRFYETKLFWDEYAGGKFGHYFLRAHEKVQEPYTPEEAHRRVEEAQLVIEAAHSCYGKLLAAKSMPKPLPGR
ncbi:MAG TPA: nitrite/sulfite reductase [Anaerolineales bacterium]|nr:nitrite/sulfite reductase [Anaerolineales bacterium]